MVKVVKLLSIILFNLVALMIHLYTFLFYIYITAEIPVSYTVLEWNQHLRNLVLSGILLFLQAALLFLITQRKRKLGK
ncbi:hypothetical protein DWB64_14345 [Fusibacter sp. A1]|nr:hypothetical protein DWB64_14345 [Fusibacter sp. A1]